MKKKIGLVLATAALAFALPINCAFATESPNADSSDVTPSEVTETDAKSPQTGMMDQTLVLGGTAVLLGGAVVSAAALRRKLQ